MPIYYTIGEDSQRYSSVLTARTTGGEYADMDAFEATMAAETGVLEATDGPSPTQ